GAELEAGNLYGVLHFCGEPRAGYLSPLTRMPTAGSAASGDGDGAGASAAGHRVGGVHDVGVRRAGGLVLDIEAVADRAAEVQVVVGEHVAAAEAGVELLDQDALLVGVDAGVAGHRVAVALDVDPGDGIVGAGLAGGVERVALDGAAGGALLDVDVLGGDAW